MRHNKRTASVSTQAPSPFLSILLCVIGTLCLLILGLNLMVPAGAEEAAQKIRPQVEEGNRKAQLSLANAQERLGKAQEEMKRLQRQKDEMETRRKELEQIHKETIEHLAQIQSNLGEKGDSAKAPSDEGKRLLVERDLLTGQGRKLDQDLREAEDFIKIPPTGEKDKDGWDVLAPMIECCAGKLVVHAQHLPGDGRMEIPVASPDSGSSEELSCFLKDLVAQYERPTIFFVVRPAGAGTFRMARAVAQSESLASRKIEYGYEVFPNNLQIPSLH